MDDKAPTLHLTLPEVLSMRHCLCCVIEGSVPVLSSFDEDELEELQVLISARQKLNHALWPLDKATNNDLLLEEYEDEDE